MFYRLVPALRIDRPERGRLVDSDGLSFGTKFGPDFRSLTGSFNLCLERLEPLIQLIVQLSASAKIPYQIHQGDNPNHGGYAGYNARRGRIQTCRNESSQQCCNYARERDRLHRLNQKPQAPAAPIVIHCRHFDAEFEVPVVRIHDALVTSRAGVAEEVEVFSRAAPC